MKCQDQSLHRTWEVTQGGHWKSKLIVLLLSATFCFALLTPTTVHAQSSSSGNRKVTQLDFIKWLVALTGDSPLFDNRSSVNDYLYWAKKYKMDPKDGWRPYSRLTQNTFAELLVDFYRIKSKRGEEIRALEREGIFIPDQHYITWNGLVSVVDDYGFQSRLDVFSHNTCSPIKGKKHKFTTKKCTPPPPPKPPKHGHGHGHGHGNNGDNDDDDDGGGNNNGHDDDDDDGHGWSWNWHGRRHH